MNDSFFFDSANETFNSSDALGDESHENVIVLRVPLKNGMIALLNHPASMTVYNHVSIEVLSGSVSVLGYEISPRSQVLNVFSSEKTGLIEVKTETFERIWKKKAHSSSLEELFYTILESKRKATELLEQFGNSTVAIFVRRIAFPINIQYLELYYPKVLEFNLYKKGDKQHYRVNKMKGTPIQFGLTEETLAAKINTLIRSAKLTDSDAPRIVICGPRNTGKSTLIRYLLNNILSVYVVAYHLDTDPGQPEFTPPGVVSLTKVSKPVMGPAFYHQKAPISMIFTGSISPTCPEIYKKSISKLMQLYLEKYRDEPLLVNTMGWMEGMGLKCLESVIEYVEPTVLIEIVSEDEISMFDYRDYMPQRSHYFQICCSHDRKNLPLSAKESRELSLLSYLGKSQNMFFGIKYLNEIKPYCVSWDKIPIYVYHRKVQPYRLIEAITESIVALCAIPTSSILESDIPDFPKTVEDEPENECIGYGLVTAVDEKEHLLYIVSPLKMPEWRKVNAILKGDIMVPDCLILNEDIYDVPLPFTNERDILPHENNEDVEMPDYSMLLVNSASEAESPSSNLMALGSAKCYRKQVPKRFRRPKQ